MLFESNSNPPDTTDQYRSITIGHYTAYRRKPSGALTWLAVLKTKDIAGDRHEEQCGVT